MQSIVITLSSAQDLAAPEAQQVRVQVQGIGIQVWVQAQVAAPEAQQVQVQYQDFNR
jgi:hypothetical protein